MMKKLDSSDFSLYVDLIGQTIQLNKPYIIHYAIPSLFNRYPMTGICRMDIVQDQSRSYINCNISRIFKRRDETYGLTSEGTVLFRSSILNSEIPPQLQSIYHK